METPGLSAPASSENKERCVLRRTSTPCVWVLWSRTCPLDGGAVVGGGNGVGEEDDDTFNLKLFFRYGDAFRYEPPAEASVPPPRCGDADGESLGLCCGEILGLRSWDASRGLRRGLLIGRSLNDPFS